MTADFVVNRDASGPGSLSKRVTREGSRKEEETTTETSHTGVGERPRDLDPEGDGDGGGENRTPGTGERGTGPREEGERGAGGTTQDVPESEGTDLVIHREGHRGTQ